MATYSPEFKTKVILQLLPPNNLSIKEVSQLESVPEGTLYNWRQRHITSKGISMPNNKSTSPDSWSPEQKLAAVVETYSMNNEEINEYCRSKGLYSEQLRAWKQACLNGYTLTSNQERANTNKAHQSKKRIGQLEKELHRKEKALAEAAALLTLGKKYDALWEAKEES